MIYLFLFFFIFVFQDYYGPCLFCNIRSSLYFGQFEREIKRKQFRTVLLNYDFGKMSMTFFKFTNHLDNCF